MKRTKSYPNRRNRPGLTLAERAKLIGEAAETCAREKPITADDLFVCAFPAVDKRGGEEVKQMIAFIRRQKRDWPRRAPWRNIEISRANIGGSSMVTYQWVDRAAVTPSDDQSLDRYCRTGDISTGECSVCGTPTDYVTHLNPAHRTYPSPLLDSQRKALGLPDETVVLDEHDEFAPVPSQDPLFDDVARQHGHTWTEFAVIDGTVLLTRSDMPGHLFTPVAVRFTPVVDPL